MLSEDLIKSKIANLLKGIEEEPLQFRLRKAGIIEGYLCVLEYFPEGFSFGSASKTYTYKFLWMKEQRREGYTDCIFRHAKNYLAGELLEME